LLKLSFEVPTILMPLKTSLAIAAPLSENEFDHHMHPVFDWLTILGCFELQLKPLRIAASVSPPASVLVNVDSG
jgi:hypothetical protein